jgi:hypothetical protein
MAAKPAMPPIDSGKPLPKFIVVHGDKGGVGKSMVAMALVDYLTSRGTPVAVLEADTRNPDVGRMFDKSLPTTSTNIRVENGWMDVMDFVMRHPGHTIIMNTPAGIGEHMKKDMESFAEFLKDKEVPIEMELWWVMNIHHDSVNLLQEAHRSYGDSFARLRVVCNLHFGAEGDKPSGPFMLWHESPLKAHLEKKQGRTIFFPGLHVRVVQKVLDPHNIMPFSEAIDLVAGEKVNLVHSERWKMEQWLKDCRRAFNPAFEPQATQPA